MRHFLAVFTHCVTSHKGKYFKVQRAKQQPWRVAYQPLKAFLFFPLKTSPEKVKGNFPRSKEKELVLLNEKKAEKLLKLLLTNYLANKRTSDETFSSTFSCSLHFREYIDDKITMAKKCLLETKKVFNFHAK